MTTGNRRKNQSIESVEKKIQANLIALELKLFVKEVWQNQNNGLKLQQIKNIIL